MMSSPGSLTSVLPPIHPAGWPFIAAFFAVAFQGGRADGLGDATDDVPPDAGRKLLGQVHLQVDDLVEHSDDHQLHLSELPQSADRVL